MIENRAQNGKLSRQKQYSVKSMGSMDILHWNMHQVSNENLTKDENLHVQTVPSLKLLLMRTNLFVVSAGSLNYVCLRN